MHHTVPALPQELLALIRHGEDYQIEYKEAKADLPKDLFDTICSFSNREGGDTFLGVHDSGVITGVEAESVPKMITEFATLVNNKNKLFPPLYLTAIPYSYDSDGSFVGKTKLGKRMQEKPGQYLVLHIHVPISATVVRHKNRI